MRTLVLLLALLPMTALAQDPASEKKSTPQPSSTVEVKAIRDTFNAYQSALARKDGKAATALVDSGTVRYYAEMKTLALQGDAAKVRAQALMDKLMILRLRAEFGAQALAAMSAERLIAVGVDRGWVGGNVADNGLGEVTVEGDNARGQATVRGKVAPAFHQFRREDGRWKMNLVALMRSVGPAMSEAARRMNMSDDEFVLFALEQGVGKRPGPEIWEPLEGRSAKQPQQ